MGPAGSKFAKVKVIACGRELFCDTRITLVTLLISVAGGLNGSEPGLNSWILPVTATRLPIAAAIGGALDVKTKTPSDVFGSSSYSAAGAWRKKPLPLTAVTIPVVVRV